MGVAAGKIEGLSLAPMRELMALLGDPQDAMPVIHVTGTNGKGSVVSMLRRLLMANGLSVGTLTSPHLAVANERIARDGQPISDEELAEVLSGVAAVEELLEQDLQGSLVQQTRPHLVRGGHRRRVALVRRGTCGCGSGRGRPVGSL